MIHIEVILPGAFDSNHTLYHQGNRFKKKMTNRGNVKEKERKKINEKFKEKSYKHIPVSMQKTLRDKKRGKKAKRLIWSKYLHVGGGGHAFTER